MESVASSPGSIRILIVDDDVKHRESLADVVDSFGYGVDTAGNLEQATAKLKEGRPFHIVLLDYLFGPSQKTGLDALVEFRNLINPEEVPILLMTGFASLDVAVRAVREGVSDFLIKPIDPEYLKYTLEKNLHKAYLIKENQRLMTELRVKNEELERLNDMKSKFLSFCAHDLSNTISASTMANDLLQTQLKGGVNPQVKRFLEVLTDSLEQTQRLIGDLVDWAAIEKGKLKIEKHPVKIGEILGMPFFSLFKQKAAVKGVQFDAQCPVEPDLTVPMDYKRVQQVLSNLLENALRHTPQGGFLSCVIEKDSVGPWLIFKVSDSGEGVDPEELTNIFGSFYQSKDTKKQKGRLGLGLSIAKEIVESHGGTIGATSPGLGKGTTFSFKIPI